jgi:hypothetical protein
LAEYGQKISEMAYRPREYLEHQLNMSEEEKEARAIFFEEFFRSHSGRESHVA